MSTSTSVKIFPLFGKQYVPSIGLFNYNSIRQMIYKQRDECMSYFIDEYNKLTNIEQVVNETEKLYYSGLKVMLDLCIKALNEQGIFTHDISQFYDLHKKKDSKKVEFPIAHEYISEKYESIIEDEAEKDAYRVARRQGRGKVVGGGFGFEGAVKGMATAGVMNAASGALHGTVNFFGKIGSMAGAAMKKSAMFNDPELKNILVDAVDNDYGNLYHTLAHQLRENGMSITPIEDHAERKAAYMFGQLDMEISLSQALDTIIEILALNPYNIQFYEYLIKRFDDRNGEVETLATEFGFEYGIKKYKMSVVEKYFESLPTSTLQDAKDSKVKLDEFCDVLGATPEKFCDQMDNKILECKYKHSIELFDSLPKSTEEDALAAKDKLIAFCRDEELPDDIPAIVKINDVLCQIDKDIRTVEGIEYPIRETASLARADKSAIEAIIASRPPIFRGDILSVLYEIQQGTYEEKIKQLYSLRVVTTLNVFDKMLNLAKNYEYKKINNKKFTGGLKNLFSDITSLLGSKKEQDAWEKLTQNGVHSIDMVGSDNVSGSNPTYTSNRPACDKCRTVYIPGEMLFCCCCGNKLPDKSVVPNEDESVLNQQLVCSNCNAAITSDSNFCACCGNKL